MVAADVESNNSISAPLSCPSARGCGGKNMNPVEGPPLLSDWQECRLQEPAGQLALGAMPTSLTLILTQDLAESCQAGGVPLSTPQPPSLIL